MKKISFVIPCYNTERYISVCLDSIYSQNISEDEFEIICVDDCSVDNTCSIVEKWKNRHSNLKLVRHTMNCHSGIARNTGIRKAEGDYICFVDADDELPQNVMKDLFFYAKKDCLDILLYNNVVISSGGLREEAIKYSDSDILTGGDYVAKWLQGNIGKVGAPWAKLFRRSFLLQHSIWFSDLVISQDVPFVWEAMICAERVKSICVDGYIFRENDGSMTSRKNINKPNKLYTTSILYPNVLMNIMDKYGNTIPDIFRKGIVNEIKSEISSFFKKYLTYDEDGRREIYTMIREQTAPVWKLSEYMNRKQKIAFLLRKMGFGIFDTFVKKRFR